ncbi:ABC transporter ATP-binding protein [Piscinibacter sp. HJYY11]|uniref:ABC transporter ATP-binding protein n=1 Tax=Piscinibacter sp. HJYY11 TaxID=2801333 RepID=UPI00191D64D4|nr:ABC transporter ATP-binding protein [Piscinibacter sp. HJYY11]MBL0730710.1 ABC transporter ATP-binding protein [Piscinibacter sp. HJYY11]
MLSIEHLGYRYPRADTAALDGVSLTAQRGSVLGLLGPNGAGKTTLISHLAGLLPVQQGQILIDGQPLDAVRAAGPTRIAVAPQEYAFYPMLTVAENLACFAAAGRLGGARRDERIAACLAFAQLERYQGTRAEKLSGGLKRRLNFAIALLPEPELVLFDEPTVGVDPQSRAFILEAIKTLARNGAAVIYTSHYMDEIEAIADRVVILDHGKVLRAGSLDELLAQHELVMVLAADGIEREALLGLLAQHGTVVDAGSPQISLRLSSRPAEVLSALDAAGAKVHNAQFGRGNLEQLFMSLTQRSLRD